MLSIILTGSVMYPDFSGRTIIGVLVGGTAFVIVGYTGTMRLRRARAAKDAPPAPVDRALRGA
ncbi:natural resistance-associated macrophage protein [Caballeronia catudaia]|uniref:Natural resistance-associated macrophage protein n=1 Tax=Caballeronia catudaia TaxID=1777136 RepID=A0A158C9N4_9BURK|nr:natural resistance-associated macrophage protein [Caballeronia catudaia]